MDPQTCYYFLGFEGEEPDGDLVPFRLARNFGRLDGPRIKNPDDCSEVAVVGDAFDDVAKVAWCCAAQSDHLALHQTPSGSRDSLADPGNGACEVSELYQYR